MIYKLTGKIIAKDGGRVAIDTGGVAYDVMLSLYSYGQMPGLGEQAELYTHFVMREDGITLYGFTTLDEKSLFLQLITVSKIGPKMALAILGNIGADELAATVGSQDADRLSRVPGIGRKTAERIILELKDKIKIPEGALSSFTAPRSVREDVVSALCNLGYKSTECEKVVQQYSEEENFSVLLRKSLSQLSG